MFVRDRPELQPPQPAVEGGGLQKPLQLPGHQENHAAIPVGGVGRVEHRY